jgi:hypothetical protein
MVTLIRRLTDGKAKLSSADWCDPKELQFKPPGLMGMGG